MAPRLFSRSQVKQLKRDARANCQFGGSCSWRLVEDKCRGCQARYRLNRIGKPVHQKKSKWRWNWQHGYNKSPFR